jgi:hypothetical protein
MCKYKHKNYYILFKASITCKTITVKAFAQSYFTGIHAGNIMLIIRNDVRLDSSAIASRQSSAGAIPILCEE